MDNVAPKTNSNHTPVREISKTLSRRAALQYLYQCEVKKIYFYSHSQLEEFFKQQEIERSGFNYCEKLVNGVLQNCDNLDRIIEQTSENWKVSRMPLIDRNIIRIFIWEIKDCGTPAKVCIDEAVKLGRQFGSESTASFVNGILDKFASANT